MPRQRVRHEAFLLDGLTGFFGVFLLLLYGATGRISLKPNAARAQKVRSQASRASRGGIAGVTLHQQNFRRLVTRYEYHANLFHGFVQLACLMVVMRRF